MNHIAEAFAALRAQGRTALMPYLTIGYPSLEATLELVPALVAGGADFVELGIPFSDPLADGATIQQATHVALQQGVTVETCLETVRRLREDGIETPLILMSYYNPVFQRGLAAFCRVAAAAGADGLIVPDLPPEEALELRGGCQANGLDLIFLLAPTSTQERVRMVARMATGFIYLISLTGVTGARHRLPPDLEAFVARVRAVTDMPLAVGFGVGNPEQARRVAAVADGVIVGSAIVRLAGEADRPVEAVRRFVGSLREGLDRPYPRGDFCVL
ncbi:MAG: tryptophan synthase subunit alpha [Anaerolineae bacterium]